MIRPASIAAVVLLVAIIAVFFLYSQVPEDSTMGWCCTEFGKSCVSKDIIQCQSGGGFAFAAQEQSCAKVCVSSQ